MATTSPSLGEHWEVFIKNEISSGRYGSANQARKGEFDDSFSMDSVMHELNAER